MPTECFTDYELVIRNTHDSLNAAQNTRDPSDLKCIQYDTHAVVDSNVLCESLNYVYNVRPQLIRGSSDPEKVWTHITRDFKRQGLPFCVFLATASNPQVQMLQEWISTNAKRLGLLVDDYYAMVLKMDETNEWRNVQQKRSKHLIRHIDNMCHNMKNDLCNGNGVAPNRIRCNVLEKNGNICENTNGWNHEDENDDYSRLVDDSIRVLHEGFQMVLTDCVLQFRRKMVRENETCVRFVSYDDKDGAPAAVLHMWLQNDFHPPRIGNGRYVDTMDGKRAHIAELCCRKSHRRRGHARGLLSRALHYAHERGFRIVTLTSSCDGQSLYAKYGFRACGSCFYNWSPKY